MLRFHKYEEFSESKLREVVGNSRAMLVYDSKPRFSIQSVNAIDVNAFKVSCWRNTLEDTSTKVAVFHIKRLTDDFLYTYFRNQYRIAHIFSSDKDRIRTVFAKHKPAHEIVFVPGVPYMALPDFASRHEVQACLESSAGCGELKKLHGLCASFVGMAHLYAYKVNLAASLLSRADSSGYTVAVLTKNRKMLARYGTMLDARAELDRPRTICVVFEADDAFDYSSFHRCVFVVGDGARESSISAEEFGLVRALCPKQAVLCNMLGIGLDEFREYMVADGASTLALIAEKTLVPSNALPFHKISEISVGETRIPVAYARQLLDCILLDVKQSLESVYLFVRSVVPKIVSEPGGLLGKEFQSTLCVPGLFEAKSKSGLFLTKRESVADCCCKFIMRLHEDGLLDGHLCVVLEKVLALSAVRSLFIKAYGTSDTSAIERVRSSYLASHAFSAVGSIVEKGCSIALTCRNGVSTASDLFKKRYTVDAFNQLPVKPEAQTSPGDAQASNLSQYFHPECPSARLERCYRKVPASLAAPSTVMALYIFSNSKTGMLCLESSRQSCTLLNEASEAVSISHAGAREYSQKEIELLRFYQVLFFRHHGEAVPSQSQTFDLHYYVAPLDEHSEVDWEYLSRLSRNFLSTPVIGGGCPEGLVWNPFSQEFLVYIGKFEKSIEDQIEGQSYLQYFERKHRVSLSVRTGQVMFRAFLSDHVSSSTRKLLNARSSNLPARKSTRKSLIATLKACTICSQNKGHTCSTDGAKVSPAPLPIGDVSSLKLETVIISSSETCFATPLKVSVLSEVEVFKRNYRLAETVFIAHELTEAFGIGASLQTVAQCLTQACESPLQNYERLEFLGDCVMKFCATGYLYHSMLSMDEIVLTKNSIVCNDNLFRVCVESGLFRYVHVSPFSPKMVQAPLLEGMEDFIGYFNASSIFRSDNLNHHVAKAFDSNRDVKKLYADVVEALVGGIFLESGVCSAMEFMHRLKILRSLSQDSAEDRDNLEESADRSNSTHSRLVPIHAPGSMFKGLFHRHYECLGLMKCEDVLAVERIVEYQFKNRGCLERAFVHPSFTRLLGSADFQYLELIGDCSLDLFVSSRIFRDARLDSPLLLHSARISYVNNTTLHRILHRTGLVAHTRHCLDESTASKAYSDMVEALLGAILVDLEWDVKRFMCVLDRRFRQYLEDNKECAG